MMMIMLLLYRSDDHDEKAFNCLLQYTIANGGAHTMLCQSLRISRIVSGPLVVIKI